MNNVSIDFHQIVTSQICKNKITNGENEHLDTRKFEEPDEKKLLSLTRMFKNSLTIHNSARQNRVHIKKDDSN